PHAGDSGADSRAHDRLLGDRGRPDALLAVLGRQAGGALEHATALGVGDVLAEEEDLGVGGQCHVEGLVGGLHERDDGVGRLRSRSHEVTTWARTSTLISPTSGWGLARAKRTASSMASAAGASMAASSSSVAVPSARRRAR